MIAGKSVAKYLVAVLLAPLLASSVSGLGIYADDFESPVIKAIIDPMTPFEALHGGETFGSVYREGSIYYLYTSYASEIYVRTSTDGMNWGEKSLVLNRGNPGAWDSVKVYCPMVWKEDATYTMIYGGYDGGGFTAVGLATASHPAEAFSKDPANPVYRNPPATGWSGGGAEPWGIQKVDGVYHLWVNNYGGAGTEGARDRQLGLITSTNLREWESDPDNPLFVGQRFCPAPFRVGEMYYLLVTHQYAGSDYAVLELYRDEDPRFHPADREFVGVVLNTPRSGTSGHGRDLDTPAPVFTDAAFVLTEDPITFYYAVESASAWKMGRFTLAHAALDDPTLFADTHTSTNEPAKAFCHSTEASISGSRSLKIATTDTHESYRIFSNTDAGRISFWINAMDSSSLAFYGRSDRNAEVIVFHMYANMKLQYKDGATLTSGTFVRTKGEWYQIVIDYSLADGIWSYTVLDSCGDVRERIADIALTSQPPRINAFSFSRVGNPEGDLFIDDLRVVSLPRAAFSASALSGDAPLTVTFTDQSRVATSWAWDMDGDGDVDCTTRNLSHTYASAGTYTVKLTVANEAGEDTRTAAVTVHGCDLPPTGLQEGVSAELYEPEPAVADTSWTRLALVQALAVIAGGAIALVALARVGLVPGSLGIHLRGMAVARLILVLLVVGTIALLIVSL